MFEEHFMASSDQNKPQSDLISTKVSLRVIFSHDPHLLLEVKQRKSKERYQVARTADYKTPEEEEVEKKEECTHDRRRKSSSPHPPKRGREGEVAEGKTRSAGAAGFAPSRSISPPPARKFKQGQRLTHFCAPFPPAMFVGRAAAFFKRILVKDHMVFAWVLRGSSTDRVDSAYKPRDFYCER